MAETLQPTAPRGLYLHVPFCRSLCPYCDFVVVAGAAAFGPRSRVAGYLTAVEREIDLRATALDLQFGSVGAARRPPLETLYLGGGTPSLSSIEDLEAIVSDGLQSAANERVRLVAMKVVAETGETPSARVKVPMPLGR